MERHVDMEKAQSKTWVKILGLTWFKTFQPVFTVWYYIPGKIIMLVFIDDLL